MEEITRKDLKKCKYLIFKITDQNELLMTLCNTKDRAKKYLRNPYSRTAFYVRDHNFEGFKESVVAIVPKNSAMKLLEKIEVMRAFLLKLKEIGGW